jgi:rhodanese-related sulfurtransferase
MEALAGRPDLVWPTERISAPMLAEELASADPPVLLDIRNPREWATKHIASSVNIPLNHLQERIAEIPPTAALPSIARAATALRSPLASCTSMGSRI